MSRRFLLALAGCVLYGVVGWPSQPGGSPAPPTLRSLVADPRLLALERENGCLDQAAPAPGAESWPDWAAAHIAGGDVAPVDFSAIPNYAGVFDGLKNQPYNTVGGVGYGVPHGRGANVLMYDPAVVTTAPDSWSVVFDANTPYKGKVTAYNYAIYIADAALYLMKTQPALGITNPYALDKDQLAAAVALLKTQKGLIGKYWGTAQEEIDGFANGDMAVGTAWQYQANTINAAGGKQVAVVKPKEGATGWSDTWMISSKAAHPNCMYKWMNYIISPKANADVTVYYGEAPVSDAACAEAEKQSAGHCDTFHATDESYWTDVYYWNTPTVTCLDGRGDICTDFDAWTQAWTEITGA